MSTPKNFNWFHLFFFSILFFSFVLGFLLRGIKFLAMDGHRLVKPTCFTEPEEVAERNCASIKAASVLQHRRTWLRRFQAKHKWRAWVDLEIYRWIPFCFFCFFVSILWRVIFQVIARYYNIYMLIHVQHSGYRLNCQFKFRSVYTSFH